MSAKLLQIPLFLERNMLGQWTIDRAAPNFDFRICSNFHIIFEKMARYKSFGCSKISISRNTVLQGRQKHDILISVCFLTSPDTFQLIFVSLKKIKFLFSKKNFSQSWKNPENYIFLSCFFWEHLYLLWESRSRAVWPQQSNELFTSFHHWMSKKNNHICTKSFA